MEDIEQSIIEPGIKKTEESSTTSNKSVLKSSTMLKVILTLGLLAFIYSQIEIGLVIEKVSSIEAWAFVYLVFLYFLSQVINSLKWRFFLKEAGIEVSYGAVFKAFFLGMFVNTFGIGTIGGDLARAMAIPCQKGFRAACVSTVLADRIFGLTSLLFIGATSLLIFRPDYVPVGIIYLLFLCIVALLFLWIVGPRLLLKIIPESFKFRNLLIRIFSAFPKKPSVLMFITGISFLFHSVQIYLAMKIFDAMNTPIEASTAFSSIPFINIASSLPITINGIGVREAVAMYILQPAGVLSESTVVFAAIWLLVVTLVSGIVGAFVIPSYGEGIGQIIKVQREKIPVS